MREEFLRAAFLVPPCSAGWFRCFRPLAVLGCGMVARLRQQVFSKIVVFLAALSLFLPPLNAPCRCGDHTVAMECSTRKTAEQTIRPSCCGQRKLAETSNADACCSTRPGRGGVGRCCQDLDRQPTRYCRAGPVSVTKHAGVCTCGEHCACGAHEPSEPPAAPAASPQRVTERAAIGHAGTPPTTLCHAPAGGSLDAASLVPRAAPCGLCVQFRHLTI
jgi:hypothetical protein